MTEEECVRANYVEIVVKERMSLLKDIEYVL